MKFKKIQYKLFLKLVKRIEKKTVYFKIKIEFYSKQLSI